MTFDDAKAWIKNCIFRLSEEEITINEAVIEFKEILSNYGIRS